MKRVAAAVALLLSIVALAGPAASQGGQKSAFRPTKTVTIVVPYSPGGGTDAVGRLLAKSLEELWGQTVIVDNRTGGNGSIGAAMVARSQPDGHTMVLSVAAIAINAHIMKLPYDTATAFAPITVAAFPVTILVASPGLPANDLTELAALVKKEGAEKRTFASPDPGSRLTAERIFDKAGIKLTNIPYKGSSQFIGDIAAGRVDTGVSSVTSTLALLRNGNLKGLGIVGDRRLGLIPSVKTFDEQGYKDIDAMSWYGLFAAAGTPPEIIDAIHADIVKVMATPEYQAKLNDFGATAGGESPADFNRRFQRNIVQAGEEIRRLGMQAE